MNTRMMFVRAVAEWSLDRIYRINRIEKGSAHETICANRRGMSPTTFTKATAAKM